MFTELTVLVAASITLLFAGSRAQPLVRRLRNRHKNGAGQSDSSSSLFRPCDYLRPDLVDEHNASGYRGGYLFELQDLSENTGSVSKALQVRIELNSSHRVLVDDLALPGFKPAPSSLPNGEQQLASLKLPLKVRKLLTPRFFWHAETPATLGVQDGWLIVELELPNDDDQLAKVLREALRFAVHVDGVLEDLPVLLLESQGHEQLDALRLLVERAPNLPHTAQAVRRNANTNNPWLRCLVARYRRDLPTLRDMAVNDEFAGDEAVRALLLSSPVQAEAQTLYAVCRSASGLRRQWAFRALGLLQSERDVNFVADAKPGETTDLTLTRLETLATWATDEALDALSNFLSDTRVDVIAATAVQLGRVGLLRHVPLLQQLLNRLDSDQDHSALAPIVVQAKRSILSRQTGTPTGTLSLATTRRGELSVVGTTGCLSFPPNSGARLSTDDRIAASSHGPNPSDGAA